MKLIYTVGREEWVLRHSLGASSVCRSHHIEGCMQDTCDLQASKQPAGCDLSFSFLRFGWLMYLPSVLKRALNFAPPPTTLKASPLGEMTTHGSMGEHPRWPGAEMCGRSGHWVEKKLQSSSQGLVAPLQGGRQLYGKGPYKGSTFLMSFTKYSNSHPAWEGQT